MQSAVSPVIEKKPDRNTVTLVNAWEIAQVKVEERLRCVFDAHANDIKLVGPVLRQKKVCIPCHIINICNGRTVGCRIRPSYVMLSEIGG